MQFRITVSRVMDDGAVSTNMLTELDVEVAEGSISNVWSDVREAMAAARVEHTIAIALHERMLDAAIARKNRGE